MFAEVWNSLYKTQYRVFVSHICMQYLWVPRRFAKKKFQGICISHFWCDFRMRCANVLSSCVMKHQYSNMAPRLSKQTSVFVGVSFVSKSLLEI